VKVITFILSAYLVFLLAIPCCTFDNCPEDKIAQETGHEENNDDCGSCSPFFTCTGCSGFTVSTTTINSELISFFSCNQYPAYIVSSMPDVHYDFWQPPKLA
jgi:hypothetical protein